jgi:hypothetical protein
MTAYSIVSLFGHSCLLHLTQSPIYSDHSMLPREWLVSGCCIRK